MKKLLISEIRDKVITGSYSIDSDGLKSDPFGWEHYALKLERMLSNGDFDSPIEQPAEKATYTLNCNKCGVPCDFNEAFPKDQLCTNCFIAKYGNYMANPAVPKCEFNSYEKEITGTMIEKEFPIKSETTVLTFGYIQANTNKRIGAKWLRSQMTANRREELIKFANYKDTLAKTYSLTENQLVVDKYLKII